MQDRFKFRVWSEEDCGYMESIDIFRLTHSGKLVFNNDSLNREPECNPKRYVVEQCTGLKDKNGRLVYEGDIVKRTFFNVRRKSKMKNCVVKWCNGTAIFTLDVDTRDDYRSYESRCDNVFNECEVIGNIHENPELVEE